MIVRAAVGLIRAIFRLYAWIVIGFLLLMAISYVFAPVSDLLHQYRQWSAKLGSN